MNRANLIRQLEARRRDLCDRMNMITRAAETEGGRDLTASEATDFRSTQLDINELDARLSELRAEGEAERQADAARAQYMVPGGLRRPGLPSEIYRREGRHSYFRDLALRHLRQDHDSTERLGQYAAEQRDISRTDGAGGEFVPPLWLMEDYAPLSRASRVLADLIGPQPLPPGTDSINVPRVTTGVSVATQADNAAVSETDMVTTSVAAPVNTIAGQEDASLQLVEQSPAGIDRIIFADLMAAYGALLDLNVVNGNGTAPNHRGILNVSGINAVTYTDASPTVGELYPKLADAVNRVATGRFLPAEAIAMHPRRWAWTTAALDTGGRPLVVPSAGGGFNPIAIQVQPTAEGAVGQILGLPVYLDANIPTNLGAGTNEDIIIVFRPSDVLLWESQLRMRVLPDVGSGTLTVRFQLYAYSAFMPGRYPVSISTVGGTGCVAPTF